MNIKYVFFGIDNCVSCIASKKNLDKYHIKYDYEDTIDDKWDDFCEKMDMDEMPVFMIINLDNGNIEFRKDGFIDAKNAFLIKKEQLKYE